MTIYAYLRVSTDKQDVDNQRHGLLEYANSHKLVPLEFREDTVRQQAKITCTFYD
jgi:DNA invertase Pin-like site-specific DNA recombinase